MRGSAGLVFGADGSVWVHVVRVRQHSLAGVGLTPASLCLVACMCMWSVLGRQNEPQAQPPPDTHRSFEDDVAAEMERQRALLFGGPSQGGPGDSGFPPGQPAGPHAQPGTRGHDMTRDSSPLQQHGTGHPSGGADWRASLGLHAAPPGNAAGGMPGMVHTGHAQPPRDPEPWSQQPPPRQHVVPAAPMGKGAGFQPSVSPVHESPRGRRHGTGGGGAMSKQAYRAALDAQQRESQRLQEAGHAAVAGHHRGAPHTAVSAPPPSSHFPPPVLDDSMPALPGYRPDPMLSPRQRSKREQQAEYRRALEQQEREKRSRVGAAERRDGNTGGGVGVLPGGGSDGVGVLPTGGRRRRGANPLSKSGYFRELKQQQAEKEALQQQEHARDRHQAVPHRDGDTGHHHGGQQAYAAPRGGGGGGGPGGGGWRRDDGPTHVAGGPGMTAPQPGGHRLGSGGIGRRYTGSGLGPEQAGLGAAAPTGAVGVDKQAEWQKKHEYAEFLKKQMAEQEARKKQAKVRRLPLLAVCACAKVVVARWWRRRVMLVARVEPATGDASCWWWCRRMSVEGRWLGSSNNTEPRGEEEPLCGTHKARS